MRFVHQLIHRLQEKGFGTLALPFNHLDSPSSMVSINPDRSIIKTHKRVINKKFNIIVVQ